ncbi:Ankyrin repeat and SOCS box protein 4 [Merluccius polli]|uniref:Ankyrin repeat and SOCS box protein 4 n=1 Tax=Merluccius polli TaxID=89951 RepID=A0AA47M1H1_MERPO|nr:Ankyrin repeat and SOCS box protein 4 [Merluccius polli]
MVSQSSELGYWLPGYKLEKSWAMGVHVCVMYNALETLLVLLHKGAAVNRKPNGKTPLHVACEVSHADCVALLLDHGARVNSQSLSGHTALHYCITREHWRNYRRCNRSTEPSVEDSPEKAKVYEVKLHSTEG